MFLSKFGKELALEIKGLTSGQFSKDSLQDYQGFLDSINFKWEDTVSLDQIEGDGSAVIDISVPGGLTNQKKSLRVRRVPGEPIHPPSPA